MRNRRVLPLPIIKSPIGGRLDVAADAKQRAECVERVKPTVETEGEFVQVGLKVFAADAVMAAEKPAFQVAEDEVDHRQIILGSGAVAVNCQMFVAPRREVAVGRPMVGNDHCSRRDVGFDEAAKRLPGSVWGHHQTKAPRVISGANGLLPAFLRLAELRFDGSGDQGHVVNAAPFALCAASYPGLIHLDMVAMAADTVPSRPHHAGPQLVENLEGRFVAGEAELPLKLHRRHTGRVGGDEIGAPEPDRQRRACSLHDCSGGQPRVLPAFPAAENARPGGEAERLAYLPASRTLKAARPTDALQIGSASRVVGEETLKIDQRIRKRQVSPAVNVEGGLHEGDTTSCACGCEPDRHGILFALQ